MATRNLIWVFAFVLAALGTPVYFSSAVPESSAGIQNDASKEAATLVVKLAPGVSATVDGKSADGDKELVISNLPPGEIKTISIGVRYEDQSAVHTVELEPGQVVRFAPPIPGAKRAMTAVSGAASGILGLALNNDGTLLATGSWGKNVALWDLRQGRVVRSFHGHDDRVLGVSFTPDGKQLISVSADGLAMLWDVASGRKLKTFEGKKGEVNAVAFSPDGSQLLTGAQDGSALLWDVQTGERIRVFPGHRKDVTSVAFRPDGKQIATGSDDSTAALWDLETGQKATTLKHGDSVKAVVYAADGHRVVCGCWDNSAHVWNADSGTKIATTKPHNGDVFGVAITPSGRRVASVARDGLVMLSDARTGAKIRGMEGHREDVMCSLITKDGRFLYTGAMDSSVRIWDIATGFEIATLASTDDGKDWAVAAPEGYFDASLGGRDLISFEFADKNASSSAEQFTKNGYVPGLLIALAKGERVAPDAHFAKSAAPLLKIVSPRSGNVSGAEAAFTIQATNRGGGIADWKVYHNGVRVHPEITSQEKEKDKVAEIQFRLPILTGNNSIRVTAANAEGTWASRSVEALLYKSQSAKPGQRLQIVAGGFPGDVADAASLLLAGKNAQAILDRLPPIKAKSFGKVETVALGAQHSRKDLLSRLQAIGASSSPDDTVVVYLSGLSTLGKTLYLFPTAPKTATGAPPKAIEQEGISLDEICFHVAKCATLRRVLVLDTVAVDKSVDFSDKDKVRLSLRGAIERAAWEHGVHILASISETEQVGASMELTPLTDALLGGVGKTAKGGAVDAQEWFASVMSRTLEEAAQNEFNIVIETSSQASAFPMIQSARP